jgi:Zn-dependent peptidase ImmA (M78 family)
MMRELMREAGRLGVRVFLAHIDDRPDLLGYYSHSRRVIVVRLGLTPSERDSVLAHELGHAFYGDECSNGPHERRAERYAAELLITPEAYAAAEAEDANPGAIADSLGVTVDIVTAYQEQCLMRLGGRTYGRRWGYGLQGDRARQLSS